MASLSSTKRNGKTCFQIWLGSGSERKNIWLGTVSKTQANEFYSYVVQLSNAVNSGTTIKKSIRTWMASLSGQYYEKLVKVGLASPRCSLTVRGFFEERLRALKCSARTRDIYHRAHQKFFDFLGSDILLRDVSRRHADDFYNDYLIELDIADSYREKTTKVIREFFAKAVRFELIDSNPFDSLSISSTVDRSRHQLIDRDSIHKIIGKGLDARWKCLLGFAGLCGLRTRCEIAEIRWEHIHWSDNVMTIPKAKTKSRTCPIFGDFRPYLESYHESVIAADPLTVASGPIFPKCPSQTQLTKRLQRTVERAGIQPWKKPWMNLRSSCESHLILVDRFDIETVSFWLGNSPEVVRKHYLQFVGRDIDRASSLKKFSNSFQQAGESASTESENLAFSSVGECENAGKYTRRDSNP